MKLYLRNRTVVFWKQCYLCLLNLTIQVPFVFCCLGFCGVFTYCFFFFFIKSVAVYLSTCLWSAALSFLPHYWLQMLWHHEINRELFSTATFMWTCWFSVLFGWQSQRYVTAGWSFIDYVNKLTNVLFIKAQTNPFKMMKGRSDIAWLLSVLIKHSRLQMEIIKLQFSFKINTGSGWWLG